MLKSKPSPPVPQLPLFGLPWLRVIAGGSCQGAVCTCAQRRAAPLLWLGAQTGQEFSASTLSPHWHPGPSRSLLANFQPSFHAPHRVGAHDVCIDQQEPVTASGIVPIS